jgi:hypothetical protein
MLIIRKLFYNRDNILNLNIFKQKRINMYLTVSILNFIIQRYKSTFSPAKNSEFWRYFDYETLNLLN